MPSTPTEERGTLPADGRAAKAAGGSLRANLLLSAATAIVALLLLEGLASLAMSALAAKRALYMREESHSQYDAELGWSHRAGVRIADMYGGGTTFTTNSQGFRAREDYAKAVPPGRFRVIALGDSFTMGYGVGDDSSYPAQMQALCPALQTVNMGQGGYGADQDYLWYKREGVKLDTDVLVFAVIAQDFFRMGSDNFIGYGKPVLRAKGGALAVGNVPVPPVWRTRTLLLRARTFVDSLAVIRLGQWLMGHGDAPEKAQFYGKESESVFAAAGLAFDDLARLSAARGQRFVIAYLPVRDLLPQEPSPEAAWLAQYARRSGVAFIDLAPDFARLGPAEIARMFRPDYHYSEEGNRFVARTLVSRLSGMIPGFPACGPAAASPPPAGRP